MGMLLLQSLLIVLPQILPLAGANCVASAAPGGSYCSEQRDVTSDDFSALNLAMRVARQSRQQLSQPGKKDVADDAFRTTLMPETSEPEMTSTLASSTTQEPPLPTTTPAAPPTKHPRKAHSKVPEGAWDHDQNAKGAWAHEQVAKGSWLQESDAGVESATAALAEAEEDVNMDLDGDEELEEENDIGAGPHTIALAEEEEQEQDQEQEQEQELEEEDGMGAVVVEGDSGEAEELVERSAVDDIGLEADEDGGNVGADWSGADEELLEAPQQQQQAQAPQQQAQAK